MCGLAGELRFDGRPADLDAVGRMTACLVHRGPDGEGVRAEGAAAFGHRRLAIIDLSPAGAQPMVDDETGATIVFNGCIYNHHELRDELRRLGHVFRSASDTEVILKAWHEWGVGFVDRFRGMFAIAIHEHASGRTVLVRDRLGIKPLYLDERPGLLRFASTPQALLAAGGVDTTVAREALAAYMSFHSVVPAPRTILAGITKLPPATVRVVEPDGTAADTVYWRPSFERRPADSGLSAEDWQDALLEATRVAVERRMVADVPVGVLLSGGFDSSLIVALLAELGQTDLATYSIGFEDAGGEAGDEFSYSDLVAERFGTRHHRIPIATERLVPAIGGTVAAMSEPMVSHDCVAFYLLSQEVAKSIKVVQSGQGADEVLGGYEWYPPLADVGRVDATDAYAAAFVDRPWAEMATWLNPAWLAESDVPRAFLDAAFGAPGATTAVDAALRVDTTTMLVEDPVKRVDTMTMAWGLEGRVPFLDHELVELAGRIPPELKLADGGKGVLKRASRGLVPDEVIDRTKGHFPVPAIRQLDGAMLDLVRDALLDPAARRRDLFRRDTVDRLLADPNTERTTLGSNALWQLGLLELWLQSNRIP
ncbi:N-acetylglutaminylglutamine amidotransferase [Amnibacterium kyonggiense]|uniref:asparagine synthase (glutamine-hydrolyzing) n=1 Tax=Amnibacterium kyonggiense TaxID=595671 RepID=A0A4R7FKU7_9MICO|nr:N-acetylglutaminylglutamine amidotransferase [Amnibacterium kyonggiense]TDS76978.1 asparagine synthase (glutamine-hydrolysing) [Amnibacterium kyonggiense]